MALPSILDLELAGLQAWPGLEVEYDGSWIRRAANGYTKRSNSVQSLDPADETGAAERLESSRRWFVERRLAPVYRVTPLTGPRVLAALDAAGWTAFNHSYLLAMALREMVPAPSVEAVAAGSPDFLEAQQVLQGYDAVTVGKLRALVAALEVPAMAFLVRAEGQKPLAAALMAVAGGIVFTGNVVTGSTERRRGLGAAVMRSGLAWAMSMGARVAALNVQAGNAAALALYGSLGYRHQYDYSYRQPVRS